MKEGKSKEKKERGRKEKEPRTEERTCVNKTDGEILWVCPLRVTAAGRTRQSPQALEALPAARGLPDLLTGTRHAVP